MRSRQLSDILLPSEATERRRLRDELLLSLPFLNISSNGVDWNRSVTTMHVHDPSTKIAYLMAAHDDPEASHTGELYAEYFYRLFDQYGSHRILSLCTDNAANAKKSRKLVATRYPHIIHTFDPVHQMNNTLKHIATAIDIKQVSSARLKCAGDPGADPVRLFPQLTDVTTAITTDFSPSPAAYAAFNNIREQPRTRHATLDG